MGSDHSPVTSLSVLFLATLPLVSSVHPTPNITQVLLSKQKLYLSPNKSSQWLPFYQGTKSEHCMLIQHAPGLAAVFSSLFTEDRFVVVVVVQTCMGSFTPVVRLCFLSFFILFFFRLKKRKMSTHRHKPICDMVVPPLTSHGYFLFTMRQLTHP